MIPLKLHIKNFLSYGHRQTIDFTPYHLICLTGKNGHGKSALLDAITWALWGQARKIGSLAKPDQGLLRLGQTEMMVIFDFSLGNEQYRIKREFSLLSHKSHSILEFGLVNREKNGFISLTDKTIRATQEKIDTTLRLTYESFINSAFLRQGQSNEFSKKSPKERKEILGSILNLGSFDTIRKKAYEHIRAHQQKSMALTMFNSSLESHIATRADHENTLKQLALTHEHLKKQEQVVQKNHDLLTQLTVKHSYVQQEIEHIIKKQADLKKHYHEHHARLSLAREDWKKNHQSFLTLKHEALLRLEYHNALAEYKNYQEKYLQSLLIHNTLLKKEATLKQYRHCLVLAHNIREYSALKNNLAREITHKNTVQKTRETVLYDYEKYTRASIRWKQMLESCLHSQDSLNQQYDLLLVTSQSQCPTCTQLLTDHHKQKVSRIFMTKHQRLTDRITRLNTLLDGIEIKKRENEYALTSHDHAYNRIITAEKEYTATVTQLELLEKQHISFCTVQSCPITGTLSQDYEQQLCHDIADLHSQKDTLLYDKKQHEALHQTCTRLSDQLTHLPDRTHLEHARTILYDKVHILCTELKKIKHDRQESECILKELQHNYSSICNDVTNAHNNYTTAYTSFNNEKNSFATAYAYHTAELQKIEALEKQINDNKKETETLEKVIDDYTAIAAATGKDGLQALIIEEALPEIEHEANSLLSKLSHNNAHIIIESLRDLKKGGVKETLDIKISDAWGIRPYEMFSGGEAFRIDFALRIALSKLLAHRAGTTLQTLIIDEGFGSQDEEGLAALTDALYKIQNDFSKIIIVSHLTSMKDHFPVHFLIEKLPDGSRVQIYEQG